MNLSVTFRVSVANDTYVYGERCAQDAEMTITVPRDLADVIEPGNLLKACYFSALRKFNEQPPPEGCQLAE